MEEKGFTPVLIPISQEQFWNQVRLIVREELDRRQMEKVTISPAAKPEGLTYKPLYKIGEVCAFFSVTRPTIYDWIKHGKLKPYKIRSRVYFLHSDVQQLLQPGDL